MPQTKSEFGAIAAYVTPFLLYVIPGIFETAGWFGFSYEVICTLKGLAAGLAFGAFRRRYPPFSMTGFRIAIAAGVFGCVVWVVLEKIQSILPGIKLLGDLMLQGDRAGFDPHAVDKPHVLRIVFVSVRLIELTLIVPLVEEVFWRGFLARFLIADDFETVRHGTFTSASFCIVTLLFASVHPELLSAVAWGVIVNYVYQKTENLWACIIMHATTNGLLVAYILVTRSWHLW